jgi:hypothetical protein
MEWKFGFVQLWFWKRVTNKLWKCKLVQGCIALRHWQKYMQAKQSMKYQLHCALHFMQTQGNVMSPWPRHNSYCCTLAEIMMAIVLTNCCLEELILWHTSKSPGKDGWDYYRNSSKIKSCIKLCQYNFARLPYTCIVNSYNSPRLCQQTLTQAPRFDLEFRCTQIIMRGLLSVRVYTSVIVGKLQNYWQVKKFGSKTHSWFSWT